MTGTGTTGTTIADRRQVLLVGECLMEVRHGPPGQTTLGVGGHAYAAAVGLLRTGRILGLEPAVGLLTGLGDDPYSSDIRRALAAAGIDDRSVAVPCARPGLQAVRRSDGGDRHVTHWHGDCATRLFRSTAWVNGLRGDLVHVSGPVLGLMTRHSLDAFLHQAVRLAAQGSLMVLDAGGIIEGRTADDPGAGPLGIVRRRRRHRPTYSAQAALLDDAASCSDIVVTSVEDEDRARGWRDPWAIADHYVSLGPREVVVRHDGHHTIVAERARRHLVTADAAPAPGPAPPGVEVVASFTGAYLAARLGALPPVQAVRLASTAVPNGHRRHDPAGAAQQPHDQEPR